MVTPGMEVNLKSVNVICYVSRPKKSHTIISVDPEKALDKTQYPFLIKFLSKLGVEHLQSDNGHV